MNGMISEIMDTLAFVCSICVVIVCCQFPGNDQAAVCRQVWQVAEGDMSDGVAVPVMVYLCSLARERGVLRMPAGTVFSVVFGYDRNRLKRFITENRGC